ncbi:DUF151 domain-containing protein [Chitinivibrio alkaliphilus]|uniref:BFN domain-containing protein n=1 Tax=Chitinivibrio alkaliphilus ACht1 TaxID=1313304 RepID=U7D7M2_9BACT|nr:DUF151 domain-containing protein [Chitinivibrio alkaliphilus]ERP38950.1 hypothetical protein CALK_0439 [Chitinivibrio alkaliphilus ACht1]
MKQLVDLRFTGIKSKELSHPVMVLESAFSQTQLYIAVNPFDANRLGLSILRFLNYSADNTLHRLMTALGGRLYMVTLEQEKEVVACFLHVRTSYGVEKIEARPGEGVYMALEEQVPLRGEESLFALGKTQKKRSLAERIRRKQTEELATYHLQ